VFSFVWGCVGCSLWVGVLWVLVLKGQWQMDSLGGSLSGVSTIGGNLSVGILCRDSL
jgi:hypothetical protein